MADFVATIKVQFQLLGLTGTETRGGAAGAGAGAGAHNVDFSSLRELREEFSRLAAQVRAVSTSLNQIQTALGSLGGAGKRRPEAGGIGVSGAGTGGVDDLKDKLEEMAAGARRAAEATEQQSEASRQSARSAEQEAEAKEGAARTARDTAEAEDLAAAARRKASEEARRSADTNNEAAQSEARRRRAIQALEKGLGGFGGRLAGQLNQIRQLEDVFANVVNTRELRSQANSARSILQDLFTIPPGATQRAREEAATVQKELRNIFTGLAKQVRSGTLDPRDIGAARGQVRQVLTRARETLPAGQAPQFDQEEAFRRVGAREFTARFDRAEAAVENFAKRLDEGLDPEAFASLKQEVFDSIAALQKFSQSAARGIFTSRSGREPFAGAAAAFRQLEAETEVRPPPIQLEGRALGAFDELRRSIGNSVEPIQAVSRVVDVLVDDGRGLGQVGSNLRLIIDQLNNLRETDFPNREAFINFRESLKALGRVRQDPATGALRGPAGAVSPQAANLAAQQAVQAARQRVAQQGPGTAAQVQLEFPTATGGIRKVNVELEALGSRLDQVRTKAKAVSDNMFDRTSVRTALQRVATWGAAAGVVFGAVSAFRQGLDVLVSTEAAVVGLAKVMDESTRDFEAFTKAATSAATSLAQEFGQPLEDILETMTLFGQQGEDLQSSIELTRAAALAANVTVLDQTAAASTLTAVTRQFNIATSEATSIVDKFNEVSNNAAVTEEVLGQAIQKAGQAAVNAGINLDQFNGIVAAISETTRQSGQEIGTALRFVFARLQTDEAASGLAQVGVALRDSAGEIRPFVDIVTDIRNAFDRLTESQRQQVAISIAGTRRFNTFLALLNNFEQFEASTANSINSANSAFREQEKVTQTASFRIRQLQNSLKELAVSFGDALLSPLKAVVSTFQGLVEVISAIPGSFKVLAAGVGIGTVAFVKLTDQIVDLFGLAGSLQGFGRTFGGRLRRNLATGIPRNIQAETPEFATLATGTIAARSVGDFAGAFTNLRRPSREVSGFARLIKNAGEELVDLRGNAISTTSTMTKFGATVRGLGVRSVDRFSGATSIAALSLLDLNSGLSRFLASIGRIGNSILVFTRLDRVLAAVGGAVTGLVPALSGVTSALGTLARFGAVAGAITAVVFAFNALSDAAFETGETIEASLRPEIAARQEAIAAIDQQRRAVENLSDSRRRAARLELEQPGALDTIEDPLVGERIRRGGFTAPGLEQQRVLEQQQSAIQSIVATRPELVDTIDQFGNIAVSSAGDFDSLSTSAEDLQRSLFNLTQLQIIEGFAEDLIPEEGLLNAFGDFLRSIPGIRGTDFAQDFARNIGNQLEEARESFQDFLDSDAVREARELQIPLDFIDPGDAEEGRKKAEELIRNTLEFRELQRVVNTQISKLQPDADQLVFQSLASRLQNFFQTEAADLQVRLGIEVTDVDLVNRAFLRNRAALQGLSGELVGVTPEQTIEQFRESGIQEGILDFQKDIGEQLRGGELVIFEDVEGFRQQAIVDVLADGRRQIKFISDNLGTFATRELTGDLEDSFRSIRIIDPDAVREQLDFARLELSRIATGAGRGGILPSDVDLGANFNFDLTAQQRAAQANEQLFADLFRQQEQRSQRLEQLGVSATQVQEEADDTITANTIEEIRKLNIELDKTATIVKFRTAIEEVSRTFEQAAEDIRRQQIGEEIRSQLSGVFGAQRGILEPAFQEPVLPGRLSATQEFGRGAPEVTALLNEISRAEEATGEFVAGMALAERDIDRLFRDFAAAQRPGGIRDPETLTSLQEQAAALRRQGTTREQALQTSIASETLSEQQRTNQLLERILDQGGDPELIARRLTSVITERSLEGEQTRALFSEGLDRLAAAQGAANIETPDLEFLARSARDAELELPETLVQELISRRGERGAAELTTGVLGVLRRRAELEERRAADPTTPAADQLASREVAGAISTALQTAIAPSLREVLRGGEAGSLSEGQRQQVLGTVASRLRESEVESVREFGETIDKASGDFREALLNVVSSAADASLSLGSVADSPEALETLERSIIAQREANQDLARRMAETEKRFVAFNTPLGRTLAAIRSFGLLVSEAGISARNAFSQLSDELTVDFNLADIAGSVFGSLSGITVPDIEIDTRSLEGSVAEFTGRELAALANPQLSSNLSALNGAVGLFQTQLRELSLARRDALRQGRLSAEEGNLEAAATSADAVAQLDQAIAFLRGEAVDARSDLRELGQVFEELERVNQFRANIEQLLDTFEREQDLRFDRTSIESALGRGPFAFARPTFEQFEQGQPGRLTAFERTLEDIQSRLLSGQISPQEATQERAQAEFERGEELISFAQQRENEQFEAQIRAAEQIREELARFSSAGGAGSDAARALLDQITAELETAGQLTPTTLGPQQITDPRTGQPVNIPASEVLQFQGVPTLDTARDQVAAIAAQVREEQARENAELINRPIVSELETISRKLDPLKDISQELKEARGITDEDESFVRARTDFQSTLKDLQAFFQDSDFSAEEGNQFARITEELRNFDPSTLSRLLRQSDIDLGGGRVSVREALEGLVERFEGRETGLGAALAENAQAILTRAEGGTETFNRFISFLADAGGVVLDFITPVTRLNQAFEEAAQAALSFTEKINRGANLRAEGTPPPPLRRASGGLITGPGGPRDDRVPLMASSGEFVLNARAVQSIGLDSLNQLNQSSGVLGPDRSILGTPSIGLQAGGSVQEKLRELRRRQEDLLSNVPLTPEQIRENDLLTREIDQLELERRRVLEERRAEQEAIRDQELRGGIRFGRGPDEPLVVVPEGAADTPELAEAVAREQARRERVRELRGRRGRFSQFDRGDVFVRTVDGRLSFSDQPNRGAVDLADFAGERVTPAAIRRRTEFDRRVREERERLRPEAERRFIEEQATAAEQASEERILSSFSEARAQLFKQLTGRKTQFLETFPGDFSTAVDLMNTADQLLNQGGADVAGFGSDDFVELANRISEVTKKVSPTISALRPTSVSPLSLETPPGIDSDIEQILLRRDPSSSSVGLSFDPITGEFSPDLFGFALPASPAVETLTQQALGFDLDTQLAEVEKAVRQGSTFGSFAARNNFLRDARRKLTELRTDALGTGVVSTIASAPELLLDIGASAAEGTVGAAGETFTGEADASRLFFAATTFGASELGSALVDLPGVLAEQGTAVAQLELELERTRDPERRRQIERQINELRVQLGSTAGGTALATLTAPTAFRGISRRVEGALNRAGDFTAGTRTLVGRASERARSLGTSGLSRTRSFFERRAAARADRAAVRAVQQEAAARPTTLSRQADEVVTSRTPELAPEEALSGAGLLDPSGRVITGSTPATAPPPARRGLRSRLGITAPNIFGAAFGTAGVSQLLFNILDLDPGTLTGLLAGGAGSAAGFGGISLLRRLAGGVGRATGPGFREASTRLGDFGRQLLGRGTALLGDPLRRPLGLRPSDGGPGGGFGGLGGLFTGIGRGIRQRVLGRSREEILAGAVSGNIDDIRALLGTRGGQGAVGIPEGIETSPLARGPLGTLDPAFSGPSFERVELGPVPRVQRRAVRGVRRIDQIVEELNRQVEEQRAAQPIISGEFTARDLANPSIAVEPLVETLQGRIGRQVGELGGRVGLDPRLTLDLPIERRPFTLESGLLGETTDIARARAQRRIEADQPGLAGRELQDSISREVARRERLLTEQAILRESLEPGRFTEAFEGPQALDRFRSQVSRGESLLPEGDIAVVRARLAEIAEDLGRFSEPPISPDDILRLLQQQATEGFASGGKISGPGGPRSDRIPILASSGEFVLNANAVQKLGLPNVELMNRTGNLPRFQDGGLINAEAAQKLGFDPEELEALVRQRILGAGRGGISDVRVVNLEDVTINPGGDFDALSDLDPSFSQGENLRQITALAGAGGLSAGAVTSFNFDQITGDTSGAPVNADAALRQLRLGGRIVFSNPRTGEEVIASPLAATELRQQGFTEKIDPDLETLEAVARGDLVYENRRTGEVITASPLLEDQLRRDGFVRSDRPFTDVLNKDLVIERTGELSLLSRSFAPSSSSGPASSGGVRHLSAREELQKRLEGFAAGGSIRGPGGPHGDRIPILASNGEFILSAETVGRIGVPALNALNDGMSLQNLPRFQEGGLIGGGAGETSVIQVDTESISDAIKSAILEAFEEGSVPLDITTAADTISNAITSAFETIELPELQLANDDITVSLDIPDTGVPLDVSALNSLDLGGALGADVRNRLEAVEGRSEANLEELSTILDTLEGIDLDTLNSSLSSVSSLNEVTSSLRESVAIVENQLASQQTQLEQTIDFRINERFNDDTTAVRLDARVNQEVARIQAELTRIDNLISKAITQASKAMTLAQVRL